MYSKDSGNGISVNNSVYRSRGYSNKKQDIVCLSDALLVTYPSPLPSHHPPLHPFAELLTNLTFPSLLTLSPSTILFTHSPSHPSTHPPICPSTHPPVLPSTHPPIHPSIHPPNLTLVFLSIHLFTCPLMHQIHPLYLSKEKHKRPTEPQLLFR